MARGAIVSVIGETMPALVLLVNANTAARHEIHEQLADIGCLVEEASSFETAKQLLSTISPDLLVVDIRLGAYNGLHLMLRSRHDHPSLPVIVTNTYDDPVLEREARREHARFIVGAPSNPEFLSSVREAVEAYRQSRSTVRRWMRKQVSPPMEAQVPSGLARLIDVSYGGLKLEFRNTLEVPDSMFDVRLPGEEITLKAHCVWVGRAPDQHYWCGAELMGAEGFAVDRWKQFVDAV